MTTILSACGTLAAESCLFQAVMAEVDKARRDASLLAKPVVVIVPSSELRLRLATGLAQAGATLGVEVQTLHSLALSLHQAAGQTPPRSGALCEVLARRAAAAQSALHKDLADLEDGFALAATSIRDLLSADLASLVDSSADRERLEKSHPLLSAAFETHQSMRQRDSWRPGDVQLAAAPLVQKHLLARKVFIYGFADAAGQARRLLQALLDQGATLIVDLPADPAAAPADPKVASSVAEDRGCEFVHGFLQRLGVSATAGGDESRKGNGSVQPPSSESTSMEFFHAVGRSDEIREVGHRIRALLKAGVPAEDIGVVARVLEPYATQIRTWFADLGIPFRGGLAPARLFPTHRRFKAALEVLERRGETPVDRWLDALARSGRNEQLPHRLEDLRIALRTLGAARLRQAGKLDAAEILRGRASFPLPVRRGLVEYQSSRDDSPPGEGAFSAEDAGIENSGSARKLLRRTLAAGQLMTGLGAVSRLLDRLEQWPEHGSLEQHAEFVRALFHAELGWRSGGFHHADDWQELLQSIARLDRQGDDYSREEFLILLRRDARDFGARNLGGSGAGVAVLDVTRARARSFKHLFVVGMNRGVMPRPISEDPLLSDGARRKLAQVVPDLQSKSLGHLEERYLFAQLCSAANNITLSWLRADDDGKEMAPSPFLQRIWLAKGLAEPVGENVAVPRMRTDLYGIPGRCLTDREALIFAGLRGDRNTWSALLPKVIASSSTQHSAEKIAAGRCQVLHELDPDRSDPVGHRVAKELGPYFGLLGRQVQPVDSMFVTRLERVADCPWQAMMSQRLSLEPMQDPLAELPTTDAAMVGNVVHKALEILVCAGRSKGDIAAEARVLARPSGAEMEHSLHQAATQIARDEEIRLAGLVQALEGQCRPLLRTLVDLEWPEADSELQVVGCETQGETHIPMPDQSSRTLRFKADRVDVRQQELVFTDYKTGKPFTSVKADDKRRKHLLADVRRGIRLQAAAYAFSAEHAHGRYLYAKVEEGNGVEQAAFEISGEDEEMQQAFHRVAGTLLTGLELGLAFPRFALADEPSKSSRACKYCELADACLRQDSGARQRLIDAVESLAEARVAGKDIGPLAESATEQWFLGAKHIPWMEEEE